ncbi:MAG TPA: hypothetical protein PLM79_04150 [Syntrophobacteraceae bacterium]|nr:hypothetical protein [Syntrophobacteraceae bacterium]
MKETIRVFVDDTPVSLFRGMTVKHALMSRDPSLYRAAMNGEILVTDELGHRMGLEGSLLEGARLHTRRAGPVSSD